MFHSRRYPARTDHVSSTPGRHEMYGTNGLCVRLPRESSSVAASRVAPEPLCSTSEDSVLPLVDREPQIAATSRCPRPDKTLQPSFLPWPRPQLSGQNSSCYTTRGHRLRASVKPASNTQIEAPGHAARAGLIPDCAPQAACH